VTHITGPPPGHTGGFGEPTCIVCHLGDEVNSFGGQVTVQGLPETYVPKERYLLTVVLEMEETAVAGFQLSARYTGGAQRGEQAGVFAPIDARVTVTDSLGGPSYVHHTDVGTDPAGPGIASWLFEWTAPDGIAPITINVASNSGNGDNSPLLDLIFTSEVVVPPARAPRRHGGADCLGE